MLLSTQNVLFGSVFWKKNLKKYTRISSSSFHASTPKISGLAMDCYDNKKLWYKIKKLFCILVHNLIAHAFWKMKIVAHIISEWVCCVCDDEHFLIAIENIYY